MNNKIETNIIGYVHTDLPEKFGVPRQSGLVNELSGYISILPPYNQKEAFNGLLDYDYIWILFHFHKAVRNDKTFYATVKPPRLGGNVHKGVFATRSPFRPNNIGLSSVKLERIEFNEDSTKIYIKGADLIDGTPVIDIKPYLPYTDSHKDAKAGFADSVINYQLTVSYDKDMLNIIPEEKHKALIKLLEEDPRPGYQHEDNREYGMTFSNFNIRFTVKDNLLSILSITSIS